jgi:hypothetical protein
MCLRRSRRRSRREGPKGERWIASLPSLVDELLARWSVVIGGFQRQLALNDLCAELPRRLAIFADAAELDRDRVVRWAQTYALLYACWKRRSSGRGWIIQLAERVAPVLA